MPSRFLLILDFVPPAKFRVTQNQISDIIGMKTKENDDEQTEHYPSRAAFAAAG